MASAAGPRRDVSSSEVLKFDRLIFKALESSANGWHGLATTCFRRAAKLANDLHGETLVSVHLTLQEAQHMLALMQKSEKSIRAHERVALLADAWALTLSTLPFLNRRLDVKALFPGECTQTESSYYLNFRAITLHFLSAPLTEKNLETLKSCLGFACALSAARLALGSMSGVARLEEKQAVHAFVSRVMDFWLSFGEKLDVAIGEEKLLAWLIQDAASSEKDAFWTSLQAQWNSDPMVEMRQRRGIFDTSAMQAAFAAQRSVRDEHRSAAKRS